jgi:hypothetical protein
MLYRGQASDRVRVDYEERKARTLEEMALEADEYRPLFHLT